MAENRQIVKKKKIKFLRGDWTHYILSKFIFLTLYDSAALNGIYLN